MSTEDTSSRLFPRDDLTVVSLVSGTLLLVVMATGGGASGGLGGSESGRLGRDSEDVAERVVEKSGRGDANFVLKFSLESVCVVLSNRKASLSLLSLVVFLSSGTASSRGRGLEGMRSKRSVILFHSSTLEDSPGLPSSGGGRGGESGDVSGASGGGASGRGGGGVGGLPML